MGETLSKSVLVAKPCAGFVPAIALGIARSGPTAWRMENRGFEPDAPGAPGGDCKESLTGGAAAVSRLDNSRVKERAADLFGVRGGGEAQDLAVSVVNRSP
jgi:hypothetical protein